MDLSIIIVSWQVRDKLKKNLQSIFSSVGNFSYQVIVVDNNSNDGTLSMLEEDFPQVIVVANQKNLGFAKACNQGIKKAKGDFILLLNPDMLLFTDTLDRSLLSAEQNPEAIVTGIKLVNQGGDLVRQIRNFPRLFDQLAIILKIPHFWPGILNNYLQSNFCYDERAKVDSIRGSYFLINKLAWQKISGQALPLLDERYFLWFEEVDFCRQVYEKGGAVYYANSTSAIDLVGSSFSQLDTIKKQRYFRDSMLAYFKKWQSNYSYHLLKIAWHLILAGLLLKDKLKRIK